MLDLTKNIHLDPQWQKKYVIARIVLHILFIVAALYVAYAVFFPVVSSDFDFHNIPSAKNTISVPAVSDVQITSGKIETGQTLVFDANPRSDYANGTLNITADNLSSNLAGTTITAKKSYTALFYPEGAPMGFKDGSLITANGQYYIVSDGKMRRFYDESNMQKMGFQKSSFMPVTNNDLLYNQFGEDIMDANTYPNDSLITVGDNFYQFKNNQLTPFISKQAFLSQYNTSQAITKDTAFLSGYTISQTYLGYADGTLASSDISVFILSKGKSYPIANADTFIGKGFDWNAVIPVGSDELGLYERQKQFTDKQPHPDGTIFIDKQADKIFIVDNGTKRPFKTDAIAKTYLTIAPVSVDMNSLIQSSSCVLTKKTFSKNNYSCNLPFDNIKAYPGNDYRISVSFKQASSLSNMNVTFYTALTWPNLRDSLSRIKQQLFANYGIQSSATVQPQIQTQ